MQMFTPLRSNFFHPTNVGQKAPAKLQQALVSFEFAWIALKKVAQSCQIKSVPRKEDTKLDSSSCSSINSYYERSSSFQQKFVVWALASH